MSNIQAVTKETAKPKVADQLISRIFDQRHFTTGEINYLTKELGERASLEENFDRILKINQNVCVALDTKTNDLCKANESIGQNFCDQVSRLEEKAERLLKIEEEQRKKEDELLAEMRAERRQVREDCYKSNQVKLDRLKESLMAEELEIERKYLKFEEKLYNSNNSGGSSGGGGGGASSNK